MGEQKYDFLLIGLKLPPEVLEEKIKIRLQKRIEEGMIEEVEHLHTNGLSWEKLESFGLEYKYIALYLQKEIKTLEELATILAIKIRQYAKRQMTWFQRDTHIKWLSPENYEEIKREAERYLQN
jgi:tRNA dimethylallyltransferase